MSGGEQFQLLSDERLRKGGAHQIAELIGATSPCVAARRRRPISKPFVQHVLEIGRRGRVIVNDGAVFENFQIVLRRSHKFLHGVSHARFYSGKQIEWTIVAASGDILLPQLKNLNILYICILYF